MTSRIPFVGLITCLAISFPVALIISTKNMFTLCPSFNWKAFERQQLYEIWPYMGSLIICPWLYNPIYSSSISSCSKVHLNIDVEMYVSLGPLCLSMKSPNSSQRLTSVYEVWSCFSARTISLPFDTQWIPTVNVVFGNSGRLLLAFLPARSPKSVAVRLLPRLPFFLASWISLAHFFKKISTHCWWIHSTWSKLTSRSEVSSVTKKSAAAISQCMGPSRTCLNWFCPWIMDRCFLPGNPATHTFFHLLKALKLGCLILLANCFKENSICFRLIGGLPSAPPKSDKSSLSWAASYSLLAISGNEGEFRNPCNICFLQFRWRLESFRRVGYGLSPRCAGRRLTWRRRGGRCWSIDRMTPRVSGRHSRCTWRWQLLSRELRRGEHFRPAITTLVLVIFLPQWPITWISLACAAGRLWTVCHVEWRLVIKLHRAWKWLLWRRVTIPLWGMILNGVFPKLTVIASGMSWTFIWWFWSVITALLRAK